MYEWVLIMQYLGVICILDKISEDADASTVVKTAWNNTDSQERDFKLMISGTEFAELIFVRKWSDSQLISLSSD